MLANLGLASPGVDKPYPVYGGIFREEAIMLLRKFYVQENDKGGHPMIHQSNESRLSNVCQPQSPSRRRLGSSRRTLCRWTRSSLHCSPPEVA